MRSIIEQDRLLFSMRWKSTINPFRYLQACDPDGWILGNTESFYGDSKVVGRHSVSHILYFVCCHMDTVSRQAEKTVNILHNCCLHYTNLRNKGKLGFLWWLEMKVLDKYPISQIFLSIWNLKTLFENTTKIKNLNTSTDSDQVTRSLQ